MMVQTLFLLQLPQMVEVRVVPMKEQFEMVVLVVVQVTMVMVLVLQDKVIMVLVALLLLVVVVVLEKLVTLTAQEQVEMV